MVARRSARTSIGTLLSASAVNTSRWWRSVGLDGADDRAQELRVLDAPLDARRGVRQPAPGASSRTTSRPCQARRRAFTPASSRTNLYAQVVNRLAPRNVWSFARTIARASSAACVARSSSSPCERARAGRAAPQLVMRAPHEQAWSSVARPRAEARRLAGRRAGAANPPRARRRRRRRRASVGPRAAGGRRRSRRSCAQARPPPVSARNSWRVRWSSRRRPCNADVTVRAPGFCTPRSDMHRCSASRTTPTPCGARARRATRRPGS